MLIRNTLHALAAAARAPLLYTTASPERIILPRTYARLPQTPTSSFRGSANTATAYYRRARWCHRPPRFSHAFPPLLNRPLPRFHPDVCQRRTARVEERLMLLVGHTWGWTRLGNKRPRDTFPWLWCVCVCVCVVLNRRMNLLISSCRCILPLHRSL